jgi:hypothetical protein
MYFCWIPAEPVREFFWSSVLRVVQMLSSPLLASCLVLDVLGLRSNLLDWSRIQQRNISCHRYYRFRIEEVHGTPDIHFEGTYQDHYVLGSESLMSPCSVPVSDVLDLLQYTDEHSLAAAHASLSESCDLLPVKQLRP